MSVRSLLALRTRPWPKTKTVKDKDLLTRSFCNVSVQDLCLTHKRGILREASCNKFQSKVIVLEICVTSVPNPCNRALQELYDLYWKSLQKISKVSALDVRCLRFYRRFRFRTSAQDPFTRSFFQFCQDPSDNPFCTFALLGASQICC